MPTSCTAASRRPTSSSAANANVASPDTNTTPPSAFSTRPATGPIATASASSSGNTGWLTRPTIPPPEMPVQTLHELSHNTGARHAPTHHKTLVLQRESGLNQSTPCQEFWARGRTFEIGGPEVMRYLDMMRRVAVIEGRHNLVLPVPVLSPALSARWLSLVTNVDTRTGRSLIDSMTNEVIVHDDAIRGLLPFEPMGYDEAVLAALGERAAAARL